MIVVAGLTPAWQQILRFDGLHVGEVNRAVEAAWCMSGKVMNVGIAATLLGANCRTVSPVGGLAREPFERECRELGVAVDWVQTKLATRVCTTVLDSVAGKTTELVENAKPIDADELQAYRETYATAAAGATTAVFTGSLATGVPTTFYRDLVDVSPGRIIVDARGPELLALFDAPRKPFLVKPNREELAKTVGRPVHDERDLHSAMHELNDRGAEWVIVTEGAAAVWASKHNKLWRAVPPRVEKVVNPIGCGDCLAAGIAVALDAGRDLIDALRYGIAAASDNLRSMIPARIDKKNVERIAATVDVCRV